MIHNSARDKKTIRQRRPEIFLHWLKHHWVDNRSRMMVILSGRHDAGRPRETRPKYEVLF